MLAVSLLCIACKDAAIHPSQSLVGAEELPPATALSREILDISSGGGAYGGDVLSYEWRPDNSLLVTHTFSDGGGSGPVVRGKETLHISPEAAAQARRLLWRVRPAQLEGVEQEARPAGCERQGPHDFGEVAIGFMSEGVSNGMENDQVGIFELPTAQSCNTPAAIEARASFGVLCNCSQSPRLRQPSSAPSKRPLSTHCRHPKRIGGPGAR